MSADHSPPSRFGNVLTAMVTPFREDGKLDLDAAARLARWLQQRGTEGLVLASTTGEAPVLSDDERCDLIRAVAESVTPTARSSPCQPDLRIICASE
jgi:4-hydroxy-tetrahydrodipicolinate synthase